MTLQSFTIVRAKYCVYWANSELYCRDCLETGQPSQPQVIAVANTLYI